MTVLALLLIATIPTARSQEVTVGDIDFPERVWGYQTIEFEVFNNSDEWKYLIVETDAVFEGTYLNPRRLHYKNFISEPNSKQVLRPEVEIPANYGVVTVWVRIHDVVDTLDDISFGEQVFEQPFRLRFHVADGALPYLQEKITLPPMVEYAGVLDNEFSRLLLVMLSEGKTIAEIAKLTGTDEAFVRSAADQMVAEHYLKDNGDGYALAVPVITQAEAEEARKLAEETSEKLADLIRKNQQSCHYH